MRLMLVTCVVGLVVIAGSVIATPGGSNSGATAVAPDMPRRAADMRLPVSVREGQAFVLGGHGRATGATGFSASVRNAGRASVEVYRRVPGAEGAVAVYVATVVPGGVAGGTFAAGECLMVKGSGDVAARVEVTMWGDSRLPMSTERAGGR